MNSSPSPKGTLLHRLCPTCDREIHEDRPTCPECGGKLVEVRDEVDNTVGTVIDDRFEVRAKIGQGGMGTVYRAWQKSIGREVAIKLMDRSYSRDTMAVRRFFREARLASQLSQPNSVSVFDFGQAADGRLFIAMELIRGRTLHEVVQTEGAFSIERCVRIGTQICDALEAAHTLGIVHRDLKLENVIVLDHPPGRNLIKVLDFGLAKNIRDPGSRATESGIVVGTPRYMSPEAATLGTTGPAGDLYSLGVILGELSVGKPMWSGDTLTELIAQKMDPRAAVARAPAALRPLLARLLDPDPDHRPTAEQARSLLTTAGTAEPGAGDTVIDSEPGATTNLRTPSPALGNATRQMTPDKLALAPTSAPQRVTPYPRRPDTARPEASLGASEAGAIPAASPSMSALERPPVRRWPLLVIGLGAIGAVVVTIVLAMRGNDAPKDSARATATPSDASVALAADAVAAGAVIVDAASESPAMVTIKVTSEPAGASVTYGSETRVTPFEIVIERGTQPITLVAKQRGRVGATQQVIPSENRTAAFKLQRVQRVKTDEDTPF